MHKLQLAVCGGGMYVTDTYDACILHSRAGTNVDFTYHLNLHMEFV